MSFQRMISLSLAVVVVLASSGCSKMYKRTSQTPRGAEQPMRRAPAEPTEPVTTWTYTQAPAVPDGFDVHKRIQRVSFAEASTSLNTEALGALRQTVESLRTNSVWHVLVVGMADKLGESERASDLGRSRAEAVKTFLVNQGIDATRISTMTVGSAYAQGDQYQPTTAASDRRAELWAFMK